MLAVTAGSYVPLYGDKTRPVGVDAFYMDEYPVTNEEYLAFVNDHPRWRRSKVAPLFADEGYLAHWQADLVAGEQAPEKAPVTNVSWFAAKAYCEAGGKRLPTLDEWEYAARASEDNRDAASRPGFNRLILDWYGKPTRLPLPEVGYSFRNAWGLWDMHGLVWEWVMDFNAVVMTGESRKDAGGLDPQLFCAAGALGTVDPADYAAFMRYAMRGSVQARYSVQNMGFRCARDIEGAAP